jgi:DNA replication protein DnaC
LIGCTECRRPENLAGAGYRTVSADSFGRPTRVTYCTCMHEEIARRALQNIQQELPEWALNLGLERNPIALIPEKALRRIRGYYNAIDTKVELGKGLWLGGAPGTYKTAAACLLVQQARRRGISATFANVPRLLTRLQRTRWDDDFDFHEEEFHEKLAKVSLLVLDDLSASKTSPFAIEQLYLIINRRYERSGRNATILTSDQDRSTLERMFGARLIRRVAYLAGRPVMLDPDAADEVPGFDDVPWQHDEEEQEGVREAA